MQKNTEIILALDSSSSPLLLALQKDGKIYTAKKGGIKQEELLFPMLKKLYAKAGAELKDTRRVFFIKGPGRFTGIRIGITLASMLNMLTGAKITSANVFDILKYQADKSKEYKTWLKQNPGGVFAAVVHAFREEYFVFIYDGQQVPLWTSFENLESLLEQQNRPLFVAGWGKDNQPLKDVLSPAYTYASDKLNKIQAKTMAEIAPLLNSEDENVLEPLYLKPARFELNAK